MKIAGFNLLVFLFLTCYTFVSKAQTNLREYKGGHTFNISLPTYMNRTMGLNSAASIQYKSTVKDVYGFVIYDTKEELELAQINFTSISEFYEDFIKDFLIDEESRKVSEAKTSSKGNINFIESDITYYDKDAEIEIYYLIGIVETKVSFYKVLSWCAATEKEKFKADFQKILYSLKD
jgi:hypothetical protein